MTKMRHSAHAPAPSLELGSLATLMMSTSTSDAIDGLREAHGLMVDKSLSELVSRNTRNRDLVAVYLTKKVLGDIWMNLCGDATFGIDQIETDLVAIAHALGHFINAVLTCPDTATELELLGDVLTKYLATIDSISRR